MRVISSEAGPANDYRPDRFAGLPLEIEQGRDMGSRAPRLRMLTLALTLLLTPFGLLAAFAAEPTVARLDPWSLASLACGIAISALLLGLPLLGLVARLGARLGAKLGVGRRVRIDARQVRILDQGWLRSRAQTVPLASYRGVAHVVRSTLSGTHHELVLAHADPRRSVVIDRADRIGEETIERATDLLGVPRIAARELFRLGLGLGSSPASTPTATVGLSKAA